MTAAERYQELVNAGLIVPAPVAPPGFKFPTMMVQMPSITTNGVLDKAPIDRIVNAELERYPR